VGQKVHPYGFRIGFNKTWKSRWFANKDYANLLHEDLALKKDLKKRFQKTYEALSRDLLRVRTGRASPTLLDGIRVNYYGQPTPLNQIANIQVPEARLITIKPWEPNVLKEVDNKQLAMALKTATPELKEKIFKNMSQRAAEMVKEEIGYLGPVRVSDVERAQQEIVDVVRRLEEA